MKRSVWTMSAPAIGLALLALNCDSAPTAPTRLQAPDAPPRALTGIVVDSSGQPVAGATIIPVAQSWTDTAAVTSDAAGLYMFPLRPGAAGSVELRIEKDGFEPSLKVVSLDRAQDAVATLRLYPVVRISIGDTLQLSIDAEDPVCSYQGYWPCRRIRVTSRGTGDATISAENALAPVRLQNFAVPQEGGRVLRRYMTEGAEIVLDVLLMDRSKAYAFELQTWFAGGCFYYYYC
jgi:hypothetical protein